MTTQAIVPVETEVEAGFPPIPGESERYRFAIPLLLAAGWGALFTFSTMFLADEARLDRAVAATEQSAFDDPRTPVRSVAAVVEPARLAPQVERLIGEARESDVRGVETVRAAALPEPALRPRAEPADRPDFVGTWGPNARACGAKANRRGFIPAMITEDGAKAGRTQCRFRNGRRDGPTWAATADCSDGSRKWTSQVRLVVSGDRLNWTSEKGPAVYVRCGRRDG